MSSQVDVIDCGPYAQRLLSSKAQLPAIPRHDLPGYFGAAQAAAERLPAQLREALDGFRETGNAAGVLYLRNLPIDPGNLPPTPTLGHADDLDETQRTEAAGGAELSDRALLDIEAWVTLVAVTLGVPIGYAGNRAGNVLQDVYPVRNAHSLTAHRSETMLTFHTEMAYHAHQPHYLVLGCLRADHALSARTMVASGRNVLNRLSADDIRILTTVPVLWHVDLRFRAGADPTTLLRMLGEDGRLRYDRELVLEQEAGDAAESIAALTEAVGHNAESFTLQPGDLLVIDNFRTSHARTAFSARFDGTDRWLSRLFVHDNNRSERRFDPAEVAPLRLREPESMP